MRLPFEDWIARFETKALEPENRSLFMQPPRSAVCANYSVPIAMYGLPCADCSVSPIDSSIIRIRKRPAYDSGASYLDASRRIWQASSWHQYYWFSRLSLSISHRVGIQTCRIYIVDHQFETSMLQIRRPHSPDSASTEATFNFANTFFNKKKWIFR